MARAKAIETTDLDEAVNELLKASREKNKQGEFLMALEDRLAIVDRALKYEALKHKIKDAAAGSGWDDPPPED